MEHDETHIAYNLYIPEAWITFCDSLLLLSLGPTLCPFAFLKLKEVGWAEQCVLVGLS